MMTILELNLTNGFILTKMERKLNKRKVKKNHSYFKDAAKDIQAFNSWVGKLEETNGYGYDRYTIETSLGRTQIYGLNTNRTDVETLVVFPGFRTTSLIWDLDKGLNSLSKNVRIFLVETNGQPNLSEGNSPSIKNLDYGKWGAEVFEKLNIESAYIAGASFGGLVCMKLSLVIPHKIKSAFLLNPGCFRMVSFGFKNMYYNLLPLVKTSRRNIQKFLDGVVFNKPNHTLSKESEELLIEYQLLAISKYKDNTEKPYYMSNQLNEVSVDTYLLVGDKDILLPHEKSISNAKKHLGKKLKEVKIFEQVGHGIECFKPSIDFIETTIKEHNTT
ncbi:alpha/beta hydrolase [Mangrovivirga sp. M17]|uniref:Alpha/beta hydrolase n=1 Tax=Mangrovivirga halotolerans TaxID=2993936 RepID=A0ABT3RWC4_9BACT|nr:alpha/beta fold hydrolase [Mangrovivirga halotolerans]MCX2745633.1 alpha/beta hydrolase [Mangrovivirga halotolerans]